MYTNASSSIVFDKYDDTMPVAKIFNIPISDDGANVAVSEHLARVLFVHVEWRGRLLRW